MAQKGFLAGLLAAACLALAVQAGDWPQFRGPNSNSVPVDQQLPIKWSKSENIAWKAKLPGYGWSSPIVWGDKVFVTTAVSDKQRKPAAGFGGPGGPGGFGGPPGGRRGGGRPGGGPAGGFPTPPRAGEILSSFLQNFLKFTEEQKKQLAELQKETDGKIEKILTDEQKKQFKTPRPIFGGGRPGGRGGPGGPGGGFRFPRAGEILPAALQERLKLTADQKKQGEELQKHIDARLDKILTAAQKKQMKEMQENFARAFGGMQKPPDAVYKMEVYCLDRGSGKVLWKQIAYQGKPRISTQASNTYASETPLTDGERLYAYFGMHGLYCYDLEGKQLWKADFGVYPMALGFGTGSSPALADGRLFIQCDNERKSFLAALDAKTGKELWRVDRAERSGYSTPFVWKNKLRTEVVCLGTSHVRAYDPATGKQLWQLGGMAGQPKASPVADAELLYVGSGGMPGGFGGPVGRAGARPLFAVKAGASGDLSLKDGDALPAGIAWHQPKGGPQTASPLLYQGRIYILDEHGGFLSCHDATTGEQAYKERLPGAHGFTSSPWGCDGKIFCLDDVGITYVVQAGTAFKVLGKSAIEEMCWSSPAAADGALFLRGVDHLYCIKK